MFSILGKAAFAFFAVLAYTQLTHAQDFQLGNASIDGSGCPAGSAAVALSPDKKTISVLFDKFAVEAAAGSRGGAVKCNLRIQVRNITPGYVLDTTSFDFRGFAEIPQNATAMLATRGGAEGAGKANLVQERVSSSGDFLISRVAQQAHVKHCHAKSHDIIKLDVGISLTARDVLQSDGLITIDTTDLGSDSGLKVGIALRKCEGGKGNGNGKKNK